MPDLTVGCHLSLGRRPSLSIQEARERGARCAQIFASNPSAWRPPDPVPPGADEVRGALESTGMAPLVIHAIYLINLASDNPTFRVRSRASLIGTMRAGVALGASVVVTHIGSHGGRGFDAVVDEVGRELAAVLEQAPQEMTLALENSAGAGGIIGSSLDEIAALVEAAGSPDRLKVVLDTAHLCGAGWDFTRSDEAGRLVHEIERTFGLERLTALHANDSKVAPGSRRDRHAVVGEGYVGEAGFRSLLAQPALTAVPWILETPDLDATLPEEERWRSLRTLLRLAEEEAGDALTQSETEPAPGGGPWRLPTVAEK